MFDYFDDHPPSFLEDDVGDLKKLRSILEDNKGVFFTARNLAKECGFKISGTQRGLRKAINDFIEEQRLPIVSCAKGFSWASCPNMVKFYHSSLLERRDGLQRRIDAVKRIYDSMDGEKIE